MNAKADKTPPNEENEDKSYILDALRKITLATIGTLSIAQEEFEFLVQKLVERGEIAEQEGRKLVDHLKERREERMSKRESRIENRVDELLTKMSIPTKEDITDLSKKVSVLTKKVDELMKQETE